MSPWEWDDAIHGWRNIDTGEVFTVDDIMARLEEFKADNAALRERLEAAMVLLTENVVAEWEMGDCCTYCGGIATYTAKGDGSPGTWNVNHRQDCKYIALASLPPDGTIAGVTADQGALT